MFIPLTANPSDMPEEARAALGLAHPPTRMPSGPTATAAAAGVPSDRPPEGADPSKTPAAPSANPAAHPPSSAAASDQAANKVCPRCGWDKDTLFEHSLSLEDKTLFVEALVSGDPFRREYTLFGGVLHLLFRDLYPEEEDALQSWGRRELESWKNADATQVMLAANEVQRRLVDCRMAAAIQLIRTNRNGEMKIVYQSSPDRVTDFEARLKLIRALPLFSGHSAWIAARAAYLEFDDLRQLIWVQAHDPNFLKERPTPG